MSIFGLTGGIGSGKSAAAKIFQNLGVPVIDADDVAREVVMPNTSALRSIVGYFGQSVLLDDGSLNRKQLRATIFEYPEKKTWLENLLHPLIRKTISNQLAEWRRASVPMALLSSPLMFETGQDQLVDKVIVIDVTEAIQIERASARDQQSIASIRAIIASQISRQERLARADYIVDNNGTLDELSTRVQQLYRQLL